MKIAPNVGCVVGVDRHNYSFQIVYRPSNGPYGGQDAESIIGMCSNCGDMFQQTVTRLERRQDEERDDWEVRPATRSAPGTTVTWSGGIEATPAASIEGSSVGRPTTSTSGGRW